MQNNLNDLLKQRAELEKTYRHCIDLEQQAQEDQDEYITRGEMGTLVYNASLAH